MTGDLVDGSVDARRTDIEPLRNLHAPDGVYVTSGNHENIFGYRAWMAHYAALGMRVRSRTDTSFSIAMAAG